MATLRMHNAGPNATKKSLIVITMSPGPKTKSKIEYRKSKHK